METLVLLIDFVGGRRRGGGGGGAGGRGFQLWCCTSWAPFALVFLGTEIWFAAFANTQTILIVAAIMVFALDIRILCSDSFRGI